MRSATSPSSRDCSSCRRRPSARSRRATFRCSCRAASSRGCASATRDDPLLLQVLPRSLEAEAVPRFHGRSGARARPRRRRSDREVPGPRAADRERRVPDPLPLLLPPRVPVRRAARGARRLGRGGRCAARASRSARGYLERGRPAEPHESTPRRARRKDRDHVGPHAADPHPLSRRRARSASTRGCSICSARHGSTRSWWSIATTRTSSTTESAARCARCEAASARC